MSGSHVGNTAVLSFGSSAALLYSLPLDYPVLGCLKSNS